MFGVDAAVDKADDNAVAIESLGAAQTALCIEEFKKAGAEIRG